MTTVLDLAYIDSTGYHFADYPAFLSWIQAAYQGVYGSDVYLGSDSQDGQFLAILAQGFYDTAALGSSVYNSVSPATAQGVGLARNVKINGIKKRVATKSTVDLVLIGVAGSPIQNAIAVDTLNQQWIIPDTNIPISGTITVTAQSEEFGAITALSNTITGIKTPTQGWQSVNNPNAATPGVAVETDAELRRRQIISVANPSSTVFEGTLGAVGNVAGITKSQGYENPTGSIDANGLPAHSISIVASGGIDSDVALAIQTHKTPGTQTYGTTSVLVNDSHGMPITINFFRPILAQIGVRVTIVPLSGWTSDFATQIQNAISEAILATPIGGSVIITKLYVIAYLVGTAAYGTFNVVSIELKKNTDVFGAANIDLLFNEITTCSPSTDVVVVT
jgi:uncharacterized phage protein gp47/JayE